MPIQQTKLYNILSNAFPNATELIVEDTVGDENHYKITITNSEFQGKSLLQQHRLVQEALKDNLLNNILHAIEIITKS
jgi:stress-induced morphogen